MKGDDLPWTGSIEEKVEQRRKNKLLGYFDAHYWNRTSHLVITSDALYR